MSKIAKSLEMRGLTYWLRNKLYISLTNEVNSVNTIALRGPGFKMPPESKFKLLEKDFLPTPQDILCVVDHAFDENLIEVSSMESDDITFAGFGEPLLRYETMCEAAKLIKQKRHGARLRVKTNGLVLSKDCAKIASELKASGIKRMSIGLNSDNPKQFAEIMKPINGATFGDVCSFVIACVESGLDVTCTAVEIPGVNTSNVRNLAHSLGAPGFATYSYFPAADSEGAAQNK